MIIRRLVSRLSLSRVSSSSSIHAKNSILKASCAPRLVNVCGMRNLSASPKDAPEIAKPSSTISDAAPKAPSTTIIEEPAGASSGSSSSAKVSSAESAATSPAGSKENNRGPVTWATVGLLLLTGTGIIVYFNVKRENKKVEATRKVESFGLPALGGPWSLVDSNGQPMTSGQLDGSFHLLYFGFTFCPDICPNELVKMSKAIDLIEKKGLPFVPPVFITLDPSRDSCGQVGAYVKDFHPRMIGLTGTPGQIAKVAKAFRVYFADVDKAEDSEDYLVDHSIVMYLIGPSGEFVDFYTQLMTAPEIAERMEKSIRKIAPPPETGLLSFLGLGK